jgi:ATP-dependent exoDNAse (exonuclease V) beta subunit
LLYVAATRAREKLIISGCVTTNKDGVLGVPGGWLKRLLEVGCLDLAGRNVTVADEAAAPCYLDLSVGGASAGCAIYGSGWTAEWARREAAAPPPEPAAPLPPPLLSPVLPDPLTTDDRAAEQERDPGQRVWRVAPPETRLYAPPWVVGKLVHGALAAWRFPEADGYLERWIEAQARGYGLTHPRQLADAAARSRILLIRFSEHPLFTEMAGAQKRLHEAPYSRINEDGQVESGIIDALYRRDGIWTIVEFKTDRVADPAALEALLKRDDYLPQAERYRAAVERLMGQPPHLILCFLDCAQAVHVHRL